VPDSRHVSSHQAPLPAFATVSAQGDFFWIFTEFPEIGAE